jgi:hypothetical protein
MTLGLGALWLLDGLLQFQPKVFTQYFANSPKDVIGMAFRTLPRPLYLFSLRFLIEYISPHMIIWDACFAGLQFLLGIALIFGTNKTKRLGLILSIIWGAIIWVFGEGMGGIFAGSMSGGIFPGTPSIISGFPGAALVYSIIALLLLLPHRFWDIRNRFSTVRLAPVILFSVLAAIQASPLLWTRFGQLSIFAANINNLPSQFSDTLLPLVTFTASHPVVSNIIEVGVTLSLGLSLLSERSKFAIVFAFIWLAFIWWFGLGLGGTLTGLGTDPNTPPAIALLLIPVILSKNQKTVNPVTGSYCLVKLLKF